MSRNRKLLSEQRGHLTVLAQTKKEREEELARGGYSHVVDPPRGVLADKEARKKWKYIVAVKLESKTLSDSDYDNMVVYCNAWSSYVHALELRKEAANKEHTISERMEMLETALSVEKKSVDTLYRYGARLGLDLNSRLKSASVRVEKEQKHVESRFGVI